MFDVGVDGGRMMLARVVGCNRSGGSVDVAAVENLVRALAFQGGMALDPKFISNSFSALPRRQGCNEGRTASDRTGGVFVLRTFRRVLLS